MEFRNSTGSSQLIRLTAPFIAVIMALAFCYFAAPIIVPVVVGISLAYVFYPMVKFLKRLKVPHLAAIFIVTIVVLIFFAGLSITFYYQGTEFLKAFPDLKDEAADFLIEQSYSVSNTINKIFPGSVPYGQEEKIIEDFLGSLDFQTISQIAFKGIGSFFSFIGNIVLVGIIAFFFLMEIDIFKENLSLAFGQENRYVTAKIMTEINRQISSYFAIKFAIAVGLGIVFTIGLLILGINYAYIWGPLAGAFSLVPIIGAYVGAVPPMIVAAIQNNSVLWALWVLILFMVVQFVESYVVTPKLVGDSANLNLTTVMVSTILWGWMWGMIGIILAVPMTAALKVICSHIEPLNPIARILTGKIKV